MKTSAFICIVLCVALTACGQKLSGTYSYVYTPQVQTITIGKSTATIGSAVPKETTWKFDGSKVMISGAQSGDNEFSYTLEGNQIKIDLLPINQVGFQGAKPGMAGYITATLEKDGSITLGGTDPVKLIKK